MQISSLRHLPMQMLHHVLKAIEMRWRQQVETFTQHCYLRCYRFRFCNIGTKYYCLPNQPLAIQQLCAFPILCSNPQIKHSLFKDSYNHYEMKSELRRKLILTYSLDEFWMDLIGDERNRQQS